MTERVHLCTFEARDEDGNAVTIDAFRVFVIVNGERIPGLYELVGQFGETVMPVNGGLYETALEQTLTPDAEGARIHQEMTS